MAAPLEPRFYRGQHTYEECQTIQKIYLAITVIGATAMMMGVVGMKLPVRAWPMAGSKAMVGGGTALMVLGLCCVGRWAPLMALDEGDADWAAGMPLEQRAEAYRVALDERDRRCQGNPWMWGEVTRARLMDLVHVAPAQDPASWDRLMTAVGLSKPQSWLPETRGNGLLNADLVALGRQRWRGLPAPDRHLETLRMVGRILQAGRMHYSLSLFSPEAFDAFHRQGIPRIQFALALRSIDLFHHPNPRTVRYIQDVWDRLGAGRLQPQDFPLAEFEQLLDPDQWPPGSTGLRKVIMQLSLETLIRAWARYEGEFTIEVARKFIAWLEQLPADLLRQCRPAAWIRNAFEIAQMRRIAHDEGPDLVLGVRYIQCIQTLIEATPDNEFRRQWLQDVNIFRDRLEWLAPGQFDASRLPALMRQARVEIRPPHNFHLPNPEHIAGYLDAVGDHG
jgi:hypothetical protein